MFKFHKCWHEMTTWSATAKGWSKNSFFKLKLIQTRCKLMVTKGVSKLSSLICVTCALTWGNRKQEQILQLALSTYSSFLKGGWGLKSTSSLILHNMPDLSHTSKFKLEQGREQTSCIWTLPQLLSPFSPGTFLHGQNLRVSHEWLRHTQK